MSLISRLKAVVAGDEYLDDDFDELDYPSEDELNDISNFKQNQKFWIEAAFSWVITQLNLQHY